mgnify:CR=1 FL=1
MVEEVRGSARADTYRRVKRCVYVALRVGKGINEVVRVRLSGSEE